MQSLTNQILKCSVDSIKNALYGLYQCYHKWPNNFTLITSLLSYSMVCNKHPLLLNDLVWNFLKSLSFHFSSLFRKSGLLHLFTSLLSLMAHTELGPEIALSQYSLCPFFFFLKKSYSSYSNIQTKYKGYLISK